MVELLKSKIAKIERCGIPDELHTLNSLTVIFQTITESIIMLNTILKDRDDLTEQMSVIKLLFDDLLTQSIEANAIGFTDNFQVKNIKHRVHSITRILQMLSDEI